MNGPESITELERKRMVEICWWLKAEHRHWLQDSVAVAWETLRRADAFGAFYEQAREMMTAGLAAKPTGGMLAVGAVLAGVRKLVYARKPVAVEAREWLPLGEHDPVKKWSELFFRDCRPELDWIELGTGRQHSVRFNSPVLPRQERAEAFAKMDVIVCELERDPKQADRENVRRVEWGTSLPMKPLPESGLKVLPEGVKRETYVVVMFELGQPAEALERQFNTELALRLFPGSRNGQPCTMMDCGDAVYTWQSDIPPEKMVYPKLWEEALAPGTRPRTREAVVVIPSRQAPFALCWIPARNDWKLVRSRFSNAIREEKRSEVERVCREYWARPEVVPAFGGRGVLTLPPQSWYKGVKATVKRKAATAKEFWLGLTAFEFREAGFRFDKSFRGQEALSFLKANGMPDDPDLIRPALGSLNARLREIDDIYQRLF